MTTPDTDASAIAAIRQSLEAAENASDADAALALLADDAVVMVPDFPVQEGKEACAVFLRDIMGWLATQFDRHITYESAEVAVVGELAMDRGAFAFTVVPKAGGPGEEVTGKYLWLLRRDAAASWRVSRLIVSRDSSSEADAADYPSGDLAT